ncbi:hypothetical protein [Streptomyces sp. NPDC059176]|uniref:hypothetical protein n=1 Tax=unclassified Streptomyces TaxID=2593676 RepID=UPI0036804A77
MDDDTLEPPGLVRIDITASTVEAAKLAVEQIRRLWLVSPAPPSHAPRAGACISVHADVYSDPEDDGYPFPTCPHLTDG